MSAKMFVMLPMMYLSRKLDAEDPEVIKYCRMVYATVQVIILTGVVYVYISANKASKRGSTVIYIPPSKNPLEAVLADPGAGTPKQKYQRKTYEEHIRSLISQLLSSTFMGIFFTAGLHWYKGMIVGMAMQAVMGPMNFLENPLVKIFILGSTKTSTGEEDMSIRIFDEKHEGELGATDEVIDKEGKVLSLGAAENVASKNRGITDGAPKKEVSKEKTWEAALLDLWDAGQSADATKLINMLNKSNVNKAESENGWTALMIVAGLPKCKHIPSALKALKDAGANVSATDGDGWNALHWACHHNNPEAARSLLAPSLFDGVKKGLHKAKDNEGKTPEDCARDEKNTSVEAVVREAAESFEKRKD